MALLPPPSFWGTYEIGSTNNKVYWRETNGATPVDLSVTISAPAAVYFPDSVLSSESLASVIGTYMSTESTASGYSATYTVTISKTDGTLSITATGGTLTGFAMMNTTSQTNKLLTGGDGDVGQQGLDHFGFAVASGVAGYALTVAGDTQVANAWHPQGPVANSTVVAGDDTTVRTVLAQNRTMGGRVVTRDFVGRIAPKDTNYNEQRNFDLRYLSDTDRTNYITYFYLAYAKGGGRFRFFPDRSDLTTYQERILLKPSAEEFAPQRLPGYPHFNTVLQTQLYKP